MQYAMPIILVFFVFVAVNIIEKKERKCSFNVAWNNCSTALRYAV